MNESAMVNSSFLKAGDNGMFDMFEKRGITREGVEMEC
jgi:hypothetical protein